MNRGEETERHIVIECNRRMRNAIMHTRMNHLNAIATSSINRFLLETSQHPRRRFNRSNCTPSPSQGDRQTPSSRTNVNDFRVSICNEPKVPCSHA